MATAGDVSAFWIKEVGPQGWYIQDDALDQTIREKFGDDWAAAQAGERRDWLKTPQDTLAYLILTDQFPRNMFRGSDQSFATDAAALSVAKCALSKEWDQQVPEPERQFFLMPLMHSECLTDQDHAVRLFLTRMPETGAGNLLHARAHREVIRRFGRFPYRNDALGRETTAAEHEFLSNGGYGAIVQELSAETA